MNQSLMMTTAVDLEEEADPEDEDGNEELDDESDEAEAVVVSDDAAVEILVDGETHRASVAQLAASVRKPQILCLNNSPLSVNKFRRCDAAAQRCATSNA